MPPDPPAQLVVLGGSSEASALAAQLGSWNGVSVTFSLAGRTSAPRLPHCVTRVGGFGGAQGLARWLQAEGSDALVDATHPFTARMPWNAQGACESAGVPRLRLRRPGWTPETGDSWTVAADMSTASRILHDLHARRVFLSTGRQQLAPFAWLADTWFLVRSIEAPDPMPLAQAGVVLDRGPFNEDDERALMVRHDIDVLVTKNSGGPAAAAKLLAARQLGIPVVMVARPPAPQGPRASTVEDALAWCASVLSQGPTGSERDRSDLSFPRSGGRVWLVGDHAACAAS
jgi:precorrin-6A/cobalt-precorrin-6A reductase